MGDEKNIEPEVDAATEAIITPHTNEIVEAETTSSDNPSISYPAKIQDGVTREVVEATIVEGINVEEAESVNKAWRPALYELLYALHHLDPDNYVEPEHSHWRWGDKVARMRNSGEDYLFFALKCQDEVQGMMGISVAKSLIPGKQHMPLIYIEYIATAYWNDLDLLTRLGRTPRYRAIGPALFSVAVEYSMRRGFCGRIGLSSLPQAEVFYRDKLQMIDMGFIEEDPEHLRHFEFTEEQAKDFLKED